MGGRDDTDMILDWKLQRLKREEACRSGTWTKQKKQKRKKKKRF